MRPRHQSGLVLERGKRKVYVGQFNVYVTNECGKQVRKVRKVVLGFKSEMTKSAAQDKLEQIIFRETKQGVAPTDRVTLAWFWENRFLPAKKLGWADATAHGNKTSWARYVSPALGSLRLSEVEPFVMQQQLNTLAEEGYSKGVVERAKVLLSAVLSYAVDLAFLPANPMIAPSGRHKVKLPRCRKSTRPVVTESQMARLIAEMTNDRDRLILVLAYHYGLTAEEVFGLTWDSIEDHYVHIRNVAWHGKLYRDTTKRDSRRRDLPLHPDLKTMIDDWRLRSSASGDGLLFPGQDGESAMWPHIFLQRRVTPFARKLGIPNVTFQIMRRSFSTDNLARDPKSVQAIMGHSKPDMTANIYAQSQEHHMIALLNERWMRLGLAKVESKVQ
jgi:integrase